jgi:hypothetical protein
MPHVVGGRVPNAALRLGVEGGRPLRVRFEELRQRAAREIPVDDPNRSAALGLYESESNFDLLHQAIEDSKRRHAPAAPDPRYEAAAAEYWEHVKQWNAVALEIGTAQKRWLKSAASNWRHALLRDITADCFFEVAPLSMMAGQDEAYKSTETLRAASKALLAKLQWARGVAAQISDAERFDNLDPGQQSLELTRAMIGTITAISDRLEAAEAAIGALQMKRHPPRKNRKARQQTIRQEAA